QPERRQLDPVRTKGVRLDHIRAGPHVGLVHFRDELGLGQVELVERSIEEDALGVEHRAHGAVADEDAAGKGFSERGSGHGCRSNSNVRASISRYDWPTTSRPIDRTPWRSCSVNR